MKRNSLHIPEIIQINRIVAPLILPRQKSDVTTLTKEDKRQYRGLQGGKLVTCLPFLRLVDFRLLSLGLNCLVPVNAVALKIVASLDPNLYQCVVPLSKPSVLLGVLQCGRLVAGDRA